MIYILQVLVMSIAQYKITYDEIATKNNFYVYCLGLKTQKVTAYVPKD